MKMENLNRTVTVNTDTNITGTTTTNDCSTGTYSINQYSTPFRIDVREGNDCIEFIYKEVSQISYFTYPQIEAGERVFKIVFSCKDGKWNKSDRIYGEIVPSSNEQYVF